jgi:hypothetical protein
MKCDWIFLAQDRSRDEGTLEEPALPQVGDGKLHKGKGFEVAIVGEALVSRPNPVVIAVEWSKKST